MEENKIVEEKDIEEVENGTEGIKISSNSWSCSIRSTWGIWNGRRICRRNNRSTKRKEKPSKRNKS